MNGPFNQATSLLVAPPNFRGDMSNKDIVAFLVPPDMLSIFGATDVAQMTCQGIPVHIVPGLEHMVYVKKDGSTEIIENPFCFQVN